MLAPSAVRSIASIRTTRQPSHTVRMITGTADINGVKVPPMAIGTWAWGDKGMWGYDEEKDLEGIREAWTACNNEGLTFYDTAEYYGKGESERIIGKLLKEADPETRKKIYIATKYLPIPTPQNFFLFSPGLVAACKKSVQRLGVDQIDLYLVHANVGIHSIRAVGEQLAEVVKLGLAKNVGVSNYSKEALIEMSEVLEKHGVKLAANQVEFSLLRLTPEKSGLLEEMKKRDIRLMAYSPLGMGRLTGKYSAANPAPSNRKFGNYTWEQLDPLIQRLKELATKYEVTPSAIALNWVICKGAIPLGGARNAKQAQENAKATTFRLSDEDIESLTKLGFDGTTNWWQKG